MSMIKRQTQKKKSERESADASAGLKRLNQKEMTDPYFGSMTQSMASK